MRPQAVGAALLLAGCYTYQPLPAPVPESGTRVAARLTEEGSVELASLLGPEVTQVEGQVMGADSLALRLAILQVANRRGLEATWGGEEVQLPRTSVAVLSQRRLSIGGTVLLGGAAVGGLYFVYRLLGGPGVLEGSGGGGGGGGR